MVNNDDKEYKATDNAFTREIRSDLEHNMDKFKDPVVLGEMVFQLLEERENTNRLLKNILHRLESIEARMGEEAQPVMEQPLLPKIDEAILKFIKKKGKATAEDVRVKFKYKGKNAASARLNRLCSMNLLRKKQAGKRVFFFPL
ncbi:hypothetical protein GF318_02740 [Candidatus Micrarchaeota archaeon]|nr:hypothetical protein [Candidatus Micrarchaeota archaeon]